jgi:hypothetical protein
MGHLTLMGCVNLRIIFKYFSLVLSINVMYVGIFWSTQSCSWSRCNATGWKLANLSPDNPSSHAIAQLLTEMSARKCFWV